MGFNFTTTLIIDIRLLAIRRTRVRKIGACDKQRASTFSRKHFIKHIDELLHANARAVIRNQTDVWIGNERRNNGHIAEEMLHPEQLQLNRMLRQMIEDVLEQLVAGLRAQSRNHASVNRHATKRRLESEIAHRDAVTKTEVIGTKNHHAIRLRTLRHSAVARSKHRMPALVIKVARHESADRFIDS